MDVWGHDGHTRSERSVANIELEFNEPPAVFRVDSGRSPAANEAAADWGDDVHPIPGVRCTSMPEPSPPVLSPAPDRATWAPIPQSRHVVQSTEELPPYEEEDDSSEEDDGPTEDEEVAAADLLMVRDILRTQYSVASSLRRLAVEQAARHAVLLTGSRDPQHVPPLSVQVMNAALPSGGAAERVRKYQHRIRYAGPSLLRMELPVGGAGPVVPKVVSSNRSPGRSLCVAPSLDRRSLSPAQLLSAHGDAISPSSSHRSGTSSTSSRRAFSRPKSTRGSLAVKQALSQSLPKPNKKVEIHTGQASANTAPHHSKVVDPKNPECSVGSPQKVDQKSSEYFVGSPQKVDPKSSEYFVGSPQKVDPISKSLEYFVPSPPKVVSSAKVSPNPKESSSFSPSRNEHTPTNSATPSPSSVSSPPTSSPRPLSSLKKRPFAELSSSSSPPPSKRPILLPETQLWSAFPSEPEDPRCDAAANLAMASTTVHHIVARVHRRGASALLSALQNARITLPQAALDALRSTLREPRHSRVARRARNQAVPNQSVTRTRRGTDLVRRASRVMLS